MCARAQKGARDDMAIRGSGGAVDSQETQLPGEDPGNLP